MKNKDLIYSDKEYEIYKKYAGEIGTYPPVDCLNIIDIGIKELGNWKNCGFKNVVDLRKIVSRFMLKLEKLVTSHSGYSKMFNRDE